jgi:hypothetical protein
VEHAADGDKLFKKSILPFVLFFHTVHSPSAPPFYRKFSGNGKSALFALTAPSVNGYNNAAVSYTEIHPGGIKMTINRLFLIFAALAVVLLLPYTGYAAETARPKLVELMSPG